MSDSGNLMFINRLIGLKIMYRDNASFQMFVGTDWVIHFRPIV